MGNWKDSSLFGGKVTFCENWIKDNTNKFSGEKFQISKGDTSSVTKLTLVKTDGKYYYSYFEKNSQTTFVQDSIAEDYLSFINTKDQFPSNINYQLKGEVLMISFSGMANGIFRSASFNTTKVN